jgi:hypothetical protein
MFGELPRGPTLNEPTRESGFFEFQCQDGRGRPAATCIAEQGLVHALHTEHPARNLSSSV